MKCIEIVLQSAVKFWLNQENGQLYEEMHANVTLIVIARPIIEQYIDAQTVKSNLAAKTMNGLVMVLMLNTLNITK